MARWLALLSLLGACGGAAAGMLDPAPTGGPESPVAATATTAAGLTALEPGETMQFEVRIAGVLAGEAAFSTGEISVVDGRRTISVSSRVATAGAFALIKNIRDEATALIDLDTMAPISTTGDVRFGAKAAHHEATFGDGKATVQHTPAGQPPRVINYDFKGETVHDFHSAMAAMRVWPAELGTGRVMWVLGGRRLWRVEINVTGRELIGTALGNQAALRFDGISARARPDMTVDTALKMRAFSVWVSDDADRVPLKLIATTEVGDVTMDLIAFQRR